jgi:hypothetical protein
MGKRNMSSSSSSRGKAKQQRNDGKRARDQETESVRAPRKRQQVKSSREPAPPLPSSSVRSGRGTRVGALDDAPLSSPALLSQTAIEEYVEDKLKDAEFKYLAGTVAAILRATRWNKSRLEDPDNKEDLVTDLEKPAQIWYSFQTMDAMKGVTEQSAGAVFAAARVIATTLFQDTYHSYRLSFTSSR